jgi:dephospho-CoA kinase
MVGCPASGKSTVSMDFFHNQKGYVLVNQDTLGTAAKCAKVGRSAPSALSAAILKTHVTKARVF